MYTTPILSSYVCRTLYKLYIGIKNFIAVDRTRTGTNMYITKKESEYYRLI